MDEYIRRQAAIIVIAKWMLEYGGEGEERERNALKQAAEEIIELPSVQPERQWIPIGSNPITTGLYLVLCNEWGKSMYRICAYYSEAGKWIENGKNITKSITHWMPLPDPWKGEDDVKR